MPYLTEGKLSLINFICSFLFKSKYYLLGIGQGVINVQNNNKNLYKTILSETSLNLLLLTYAQ